MLHDLIRKFKGKETVMMTDELPRVKKHKKKLCDSQRHGIVGVRVEYEIRPTNSNEKYKKTPSKMDLSGDRQIPRVPR